MDIVPEFNTRCYLTINDQVRGDVRCYPLRQTGDAERLVADFVTTIGGGRIVTRPYSYEIFDHDRGVRRPRVGLEEDRGLTPHTRPGTLPARGVEPRLPP